jgi:hypothetical protein
MMTTTADNQIRSDFPLFQQLDLDAEKDYFLYVGEIRAYALNPPLSVYLQKMLRRPVEFVALVPDVLARYPYSNLVVINPAAYRWQKEKGIRVSSRPTAAEFARIVSESPWVRDLIRRLLHHQEAVYVHPYESRPELTLPDGKQVKLIGPEPDVAHRLNNKLRQFEVAQKLGIPCPEGRCCASLQEALGVADAYFCCGHEVFISEPYSAAGSHSIFAASRQEIVQRFTQWDRPYLVTRRIPHRHDPSVSGVVANEEEIYLISVADQRMDENRYLGASFPSVLPVHIVDKLKRYARSMGRYSASQGFRGIFGCDFIVDDYGSVYFMEINARKTGTILETALTMEHTHRDLPSLAEIEFHAIARGRLPGGLQEINFTQSALCWATFNVKSHQDVVVTADIQPRFDEKDLFRVVAEDTARAEATVLDHLGPGIHQEAGGFVGRCIAVGKTHTETRALLEHVIDLTRSSMTLWKH